MDLVGLVSGGKDSVYNMVEAVRLGHRIVCCANLHPGAPGGGAAPQELDSWMYQTVGWNIVPVVCEALGLPLVRRVTRGVAVHTGLAYPSSGPGCSGEGGAVDEVEDLHQLLVDVLAAHPSVRGVAVGAILSSYQRVRVESVCARLGLVPVALLWQREQQGLLQDMAASGLRALLVKVASFGLTPERHLGREAAALLPSLLALHRQLGLHVCGEGGEYETLTLDSPLHRAGVVQVGESRVVADPGGRGATAHLHIASAAVLPREGGTAAAEARAAQLLAWDWKEQLGLPGQQAKHTQAPPYAPAPLPPTPSAPLPLAQLHPESLPPGRPPFAASSGSLQGDTTLLSLTEPALQAPSATAAAQALLRTLTAALAAAGCALCDVVHLHLSLALMGSFGEVNAVFAGAFAGAGLPHHPPSRTCLQLSAAHPCHPHALALQVLAVRGSGRSAALGHGSHRRTTLVASLSKWAPMCIGPYAQCVALEEALVLPAGQIGLLPQSMGLVGGGVGGQLAQALLNLARVCASAGSGLPCALSLVVYVAGGGGEEALAAVQQGVAQWLGREEGREEEEEQGQGSEEEEEEEGESRQQSAAAAAEYEFSLGPYAHTVRLLPAGSAAAPPRLPPVAVIPVAALPRGAAVEVEAVCVSGEAVGVYGGLTAVCTGEGAVLDGSSSGGGGAPSLPIAARARMLPGGVGCLWLQAECRVGGLLAAAQALAAQAEGVLGGEGRLRSAASSWCLRVYFEAGAAGEEEEEEGGWGEGAVASGFRAAFEGLAGQLAVSAVAVAGGEGLGLLGSGRGQGGGRGAGQRVVLVQVLASNLGALRGQLWLRRAYKSCGVAE